MSTQQAITDLRLLLDDLAKRVMKAERVMTAAVEQLQRNADSLEHVVTTMGAVLRMAGIDPEQPVKDHQ